VVYVEFDWKTEIRAARQVVMERITTVPMPEGVRPQMTPPASIMGQILHVGLLRRQGPQGGDLAAVGQTGLLAERVASPAPLAPGGKGQPVLTVWRPRHRNDLSSWERVNVENLSWDATAPGRTATFVYNGRSHTVTFRTPLEERMDIRTTADWVIR